MIAESHNPKPIKRWIILFSGFRQDASTMTGSVKVWRSLYDQHAGPQCVVSLYPWDTAARPLAHMIRNNRNGEDPEIILGGYSFGGQTAVNLAKQLQFCGLYVSKMVLADPVYRHRYYAGWWRSLMPWAKIAVPSNVQDCRYFLQKNEVFWPMRDGGWIQPRGHRLYAQEDFVDGARALIRDPIYLTCDHSNMDDSPHYLSAMLGACKCD